MITTVKIRDNFSRIAQTYELYADIQNLLADELLGQIRKEKLSVEDIIDIGCGTGRLLLGLSKIFPKAKIKGLDVSLEMARISRDRGIETVIADAEKLPFKKETFDLIISNATYQWIVNLDNAFREANRILKKNSSFIFTCFGPDTFCELRNCFGIGENFLPAKDFIYKGLKGAGFKNIEIKTDLRYKDFDSLRGILFWLKKIGGNHIHSIRPFLTPRKFMAAGDFYSRNYRNNGKVYATFEVIWVKAKKS